MKYEVVINGVRRSVEFTPPAGNTSSVTLNIDGREVSGGATRLSHTAYSILVAARSFEVTVEEQAGRLLARTARREFRVEIFDPRSWRRRKGGGIELEGRQQMVAPMPGKIVRVLAAPGERVAAGQGLLVIEAMKMQNEIRSPKSGTVEKLAAEGQTVNAGEVIAIVL